MHHSLLLLSSHQVYCLLSYPFSFCVVDNIVNGLRVTIDLNIVRSNQSLVSFFFVNYYIRIYSTVSRSLFSIHIIRKLNFSRHKHVRVTMNCSQLNCNFIDIRVINAKFIVLGLEFLHLGLYRFSSFQKGICLIAHYINHGAIMSLIGSHSQ